MSASSLYPLDVNGEDYKFIETDFGIKKGDKKNKPKSLKRGLDMVDKIVNYDKEELIQLIKGEANWKDYANLGTSLFSAAACFIPIAGPAVSAVIDVFFGLLFEFVASTEPKKPTPEEIMNDIAKQKVIDFFKGLTTGKLDDVRTALGELQSKTLSLAKNNAKVINISNFTSQYNILFTEISSLFNQTINQPMEFRLTTYNLFTFAVQIYMIRVISLTGMRKTLALTPEFLKNTLYRHIDIAQFLYLRNTYVEAYAKLKELENGQDLFAYLDTRNTILQNCPSIYNLMFTDPQLFPDGVFVENPIVFFYIYKHSNYVNYSSQIVRIVLADMKLRSNYFLYTGSLTEINCRFNASGQFREFNCVGECNRYSGFYPVYNQIKDSQSTIQKKYEIDTSLLKSFSIGLGNTSGNLIVETSAGTVTLAPGVKDAIYPTTQMNFNDVYLPNTKVVHIGTFKTSNFIDSRGLVPFVGVVDKTAEFRNFLYSSCATVINPGKMISNMKCFVNFDHLYIGYHTITVLGPDGYLEYELTPKNPAVITFKVYVQITCGYFYTGAQNDSNFTNAINKAKEKALDNTVPLEPLVKVSEGTNVDCKMVTTKKTKVQQEWAIGKGFKSKLVEVGNINLDTPGSNKLKIACTVANSGFIVEAIIFKPVIKVESA
ncbi:hypothetical protein CYY_005233 [Polysphondylium violaceum]|uniref:Pesticidal crystal protein N-terminal domain-containing protein n=1 Tax=Polysphondylium violaceum TaxID=133409 RepID=A0A8J4PT97_9MYCE|nr:hypothetical protein CYY_005233 [Polysphondylium violaceum]